MTAESVAARLLHEVAAGRLEFDPSQRDAALHLDRLNLDLAGPPPSLAGRLRRMTRPRRARAAPRGVYLWGGVGRGKTLSMDLFVDTLPPGWAERSHFYHFMRQVHELLHALKQRSDPLHEVAQRFADRTRVLCLDEFFVADIADAMILGGLIDALFERGVALVTTSNLPPQDLYKDGLQRPRFMPAIALLQANLDIVHLDGGVDYRLRRLAQAPNYLDSGKDGTQTDLERRFDAVAGVICTRPASLDIEGRLLRAERTAPGMVWFEFKELCDGPRSQNDYIELAHLYHTVFIANIPVFDRHSDDAARRFIMLIDELYDRRVNIVVSAAAPASKLYQGERLQFEFERAASRLIEMQTQQYLAATHRP